MTKRMKKAIKFLPIPFLLLLFLLFLLFLKRAGFERISCPIPLKQLALYSGGTAWGLSLENEVLYSTKGLEEFQPVKTLDMQNPSSDGFTNAVFWDEQTAYISYFSSDNEHLVIEATYDGGITWRQTLLNYDNKTCDAGSVFLCFEDSAHGYLLHCSTPAAGQMRKMLYYTDNAGKTYTFLKDLTDIIAGYPQGITAVKDSTIQIAVTYHGTDNYLYQSLDNAKTWEPVEIFPRSDHVGYIDGFVPVYSKNNPQNAMILLKVVNETAAYRLYVTKDGGEHWNFDSEVPCESVRSSYLGDDQTIHIIDMEGNVYQK